LNETSQPDAQFSISLNANSALFDDTSLPNVLSAERFPSAGRGGVLDNPMVSGIDLFFNEIELQPLVRGDYNGDMVVDNLDYAVWRSAFGSSTKLAADGNFNGAVDAADYLIWRRNIGAGDTSPANFSAVPEPTTVKVLFVVSVGFSLRRERLFRCRLTV
jgi:hypothetical protein